MISFQEENVSKRMNRVTKLKATTKAEMLLWTRNIHEQENAEKGQIRSLARLLPWKMHRGQSTILK